MIPKRLHLCWLSGDEFPPFISYCLETWKKVLPDYEIVLWDSKRFDIDSVPWVKEAFECRKYAFAADYIRFYALWKEGGIYLDSDVEVLKSFDPLLTAKSFIGFEASTGHYEAAIVGAEAGTQWCKDILDSYEGLHFDFEQIKKSDWMVAPQVVGRALAKRYPDAPVLPPEESVIINGGELVVHPAEFFSPIRYDIEKSYSKDRRNDRKYKKNKNTYCIHRFTGAWTQKPSFVDQLGDFVRNKLKQILGPEKGEAVFKAIKFRNKS